MAEIETLADWERAALGTVQGSPGLDKLLRIHDAQAAEIARQAEEITNLKAEAETARKEIAARQTVAVEQTALARAQAQRIAELEAELSPVREALAAWQRRDPHDDFRFGMPDQMALGKALAEMLARRGQQKP